MFYTPKSVIRALEDNPPAEVSQPAPADDFILKNPPFGAGSGAADKPGEAT